MSNKIDNVVELISTGYKVKDLIQELQKLDPELYVVYYDGDHGYHWVGSAEIHEAPYAQVYNPDTKKTEEGSRMIVKVGV